MAGKQLFEPLRIGSLTLKNRICVPPMVSRWKPGDGSVTREHIDHYRQIAAGGPGLVIVEATCVTKAGRLQEGQLGIWDDCYIDGLRSLADAVHQEGCPVFLQIHHAGLKSIEDPLCAEDYTLRPGVTGRKMTVEEIHSVREDFIRAGVRAHQAGFDGVELHGCHEYLICQFLNTLVNRRKDEYGREPERFVLEILDGLRRRVPDDFIIGIRLGAFEPNLKDGLRYGRMLEENRIDFLNISYGCVAGENPFEGEDPMPADFPFKDVVYAAGVFKRQSKVPVFAVRDIRTPRDAQRVLDLTGVDMVNIGRSILADPEWPNKAKRGEEPGVCLDCKVCQWRIDKANCAGRRLVNK